MLRTARTLTRSSNSLRSDAGVGLTDEEARARLERYGRNELAAEKPVPAWRRFLAQFQDVLVILLLVATAISAGLWALRARRGIALRGHRHLRGRPAQRHDGLRPGVAGGGRGRGTSRDVGSAMPPSFATANAAASLPRRSSPATSSSSRKATPFPPTRALIESTALQTAEAALTGESLPVTKDTAPIAEDVRSAIGDNMVFSGTAATYGHGKAVVTATGMRTEMGRIAGLLKETPDEPTPLQRELDRTGKMLGLVVVAIAVVMIATIILVEDVRGASALFDVLILGVALAVAAVPEGLPAVVTAVLSIGVQRMARRNAIVRHLAAVETLGSASVIASDKTGTLTKNEMTVRVVVTASGRVTFEGSGYAPDRRRSARGGGPIDGPLRVGTRARPGGRRSREQRPVQERDGRWTVQGDPDRRRAAGRRAEGGSRLGGARRSGCPASARCRSLPSAS